MRHFTLLIITLLAVGCNKAARNRSSDDIPQDTVYDGDIIWREKWETKRPIIQLDNGIEDRPLFTIGDTSLLRIRIPRFTEYEMHLRKIVGATILRVDSSQNKFLVVPTNNRFSFVLMQFYPKGKVIRYTRNWNEQKSVYEEQVVPLDSLIQIGRLEFKAE